MERFWLSSVLVCRWFGIFGAVGVRVAVRGVMQLPDEVVIRLGPNVMEKKRCDSDSNLDKKMPAVKNPKDVPRGLDKKMSDTENHKDDCKILKDSGPDDDDASHRSVSLLDDHKVVVEAFARRPGGAGTNDPREESAVGRRRRADSDASNEVIFLKESVSRRSGVSSQDAEVRELVESETGFLV